MSTAPELKKGLKQRHLTMIAIGGVIGAGLFVGSGVVLQTTGPGAFLTYAVTGVLIVMVMRMLGEMATANPSTGSFSDYSRAALGHWAGFSVALRDPAMGIAPGQACVVYDGSRVVGSGTIAGTSRG